MEMEFSRLIWCYDGECCLNVQAAQSGGPGGCHEVIHVSLKVFTLRLTVGEYERTRLRSSGGITALCRTGVHGDGI